ncbi:glycoside hydrolase [Phyllobacterium brassicacearum]|uniref:Glycoside hydrolase n=1 Tax=Phyllobacterium brassicacearum TaxID=314235 RepID=A0A2P7BVY9_9HYPH|nr:glycoside hydrolase [Phyllobacterium brassicacearum]PSH70630.1 glycoside hydrolase [Phyllobacterium brassicacearum]TDQ35903.1 UDP-N-acetylmuramyl pentapeptide phosphotransferase/UDP-N-acetylglucosamine-1-phosphate transferase [Phyllobacterium brassicacearum]
MPAIIIPFLVTAIASTVLLAVIMRILPADFLGAAVTERSNHTQAAQQLGGLAIVPAIICSLWIFGPENGLNPAFLACATIASLLLWVIGFLDDRHHLPESIRLLSQFAASTIAVYGLGPDFRLLPDLLPFLLERGLLVLALVYFINLTNFMDGLDLMVVSGLGVPLALLAGFSGFGLVAIGTGNLAAAIAGGLAGFAIFNRPKARVFLGDSGSLPIGLLSGLACFLVARDMSIWAGLILPLFFIADATSTLLMRLAAGENILAAHSKHAYQVAKRSGWSVWQVVSSVGLLNLILGACALATIQHGLPRLVGILVALFAVALVLYRFRNRKN